MHGRMLMSARDPPHHGHDHGSFTRSRRSRESQVTLLAGPTPPHKPKAQAHEDARVLSIRIARLVVGTPPLTLSLISSVRLPVEDRPVARPHEGLGLLVEHRKHIVALCRGALPSLPFEKDE